MEAKSKSISNIELQMQRLDPGSYRYQTLQASKDFKNSWIILGRYLYTVYKDKLYKDWGFLTFEAYCAKEVGIRQNTAVKLLKSYYFLEKEEPDYLQKEAFEKRRPDQIPTVDSVNALRLAKGNEAISEDDYEELRDDVLENAREESEVKKKVRYLLKTGPKASETQAMSPKEESLKRLAQYLQNYKNGISDLDVPVKISKKLDELLELLADYLRP
ncbi:MAG: hypothetical protein WCG06_02410 [Candidatus Omnitrophota bacterium]